MHRAIADRCRVSDTIRKVIVNPPPCDFALNEPRYKFETLCRSKQSPCVLVQIPAFFLKLFNLSNGFPGGQIILLFRSDWVRVVLEYFCFGLPPKGIIRCVALTTGCISKKIILCPISPHSPCAPDVPGAYNVNSSSGCVRPGSFRPQVKGPPPMRPDATGCVWMHWTRPLCVQTP